MTIQEFNKGMREHFSVEPAKYLCRTSLLLKRAALDVIAFDDYLHERYGNYETSGKSMVDIIAEKYGDAAVNFCKKAL